MTNQLEMGNNLTSRIVLIADPNTWSTLRNNVSANMWCDRRDALWMLMSNDLWHQMMVRITETLIGIKNDWL